MTNTATGPSVMRMLRMAKSERIEAQMSKPIVFFSHLAEEAEVAIAFKKIMEHAFLGLFDIFVSSDSGSLAMGDKWLETIVVNLKACSVEVVLCSPKSVQRPWINFEAGAGWIRDIPVIPICHAGIKPSDLPIPLKLLHAASATDVKDLNAILPVLATAIGAARTPSVDFAEFISVADAFDKRVNFWSACHASFDALRQLNAGLVPALIGGQTVQIELTDKQIDMCEGFAKFWSESKLLRFSARVGTISLAPTGTTYTCILEPLTSLRGVAADPEFAGAT